MYTWGDEDKDELLGSKYHWDKVWGGQRLILLTLCVMSSHGNEDKSLEKENESFEQQVKK